jgi:hypothetical protein
MTLVATAFLDAATAMGQARGRCVALVVAAAAVVPLPAAAQFAGSRAAFIERPRIELVQFRDFFRFPFGDDRERDRGFYSPYNPYTPPRPSKRQSRRRRARSRPSRVRSCW